VSLPSHGENRGSSTLGSANDFSILAPKWSIGMPANRNLSERGKRELAKAAR
jgi:hypothetical protein